MPSNAADNTEVFIYMGPVGNVVPQHVVRLRVDPSVTLIPDQAFYQRKKLAEVELCEGLVEIGEGALGWCDRSITTINIPTSLRRILHNAFTSSLRCPIRLHDGIESIGHNAFASCIFTNFRIPPLITVIPISMLMECRATFSIETPKIITKIKDGAFHYCHFLRNLALPPNAVIGDIFGGQSSAERCDLYQLFGSIAEIIRELQHRFDGLLIHCAVYYQSYYQGELQRLITSGNELDLTGNERDCLGMTPLHILACSSVHNLEVYRLIVEEYPTNLIIEDRWGALPLLYAILGGAPHAITQFLLDSYQSLYPDHVFNWTMMVETMGRCDTQKERIENLLHVKQTLSPNQPINWDYLLDKFAESSERSFPGVPFHERMQFLFTCGMSTRVKTLAFKVWRDYVSQMILTADFEWNEDNRSILRSIRNKLAHFEVELTKLNEVTTILELALWKTKITENGHQDMATHDANVRIQDRVTCGADVVIGHVLPFLINTE
jgi:hypothetical protein